MTFFSQVRQRAALQLVDLDTAETFRWDIDMNWEQDNPYIKGCKYLDSCLRTVPCS